MTNNNMVGYRSYEKFIPPFVQVAPIEFRLEFLRGLMDTDGYCDERGRCYYCTTSTRLRDDFMLLVRGLGGKASCRVKHPTYTLRGEKLHGREAYDIRVWLKKTSALFRLSRKRARCRDSWNGGYEITREVKSFEFVGKKKAMCIRVSSPFGLYLTNDYIVTHNSSAVAIDVLRYFDVPNFAALIMRRTWMELSEGAESMIQFLKEKLEPFMVGKNAPVTYHEKDHIFRSREGGIIQLAHAENEKDIEKRAGTPYQRIYFEELCSFTEYQYDFMFSRQRKRAHGLVAQVPVVMRGTGNPLGVGYEFVKERFIVNNNKERIFIPSGLMDNPFIDREDYKKRLEKLPEVLRKKLMDGDWDVQFSGGVVDRNWYEVVPLAAVPECKFWVRAWDLAATVPTSANPNPDWTVGVKMGYDYDKSKRIYIDARTLRRFRASSGEVELEIERCMDEDGPQVVCVIEQQPGEAGKREMERLRKKWIGRNVIFKAETQRGKEERLLPFASYSHCKGKEEGLVKLIDGKHVEAILSELSMFGQKGVKDDVCDGLSLGFRALTEMTHRTVIRSGMATNSAGIEQLHRSSLAKMGLLTKGSRWW